MEKCDRCGGTGEMDTECCNGSGGCSCRGKVVYLTCTYCDGRGQVEDNVVAKVEGHRKYMTLYGHSAYLGTGPRRY
jgi:hypothetical protein